MTAHRCAVGQRDWAALVRGKDTYRHFAPEYVPKRDLEPEALAFDKAVIEEQPRVLYRGTDKMAYRAWARSNSVAPCCRGDKDRGFLALDLGKGPDREDHEECAASAGHQRRGSR